MSSGPRLDTQSISNDGARYGATTMSPEREAMPLAGVLSRAAHDPDLLAVAEIESLQRTVGNRAVVDLIQRQPARRAAPRQPPPEPTMDQIAAEIGSGLGGPYADYAAYSATMTAGTFLGHSIRNGVRAEFLTKLDDAKVRIDAEYAASGVAAPRDYGISSVGGYRNAAGMHGWGLAIDIDVAKNPYVMHEAGEATMDAQLAPVYHHIAEFMLNDPIGTEQSIIPTVIGSGGGMTATSTGGRRDRVAEYFDRLTLESEAMKEYFALMTNSAALATFLTGTWTTKHPQATPPVAADVVRQMWEDYATLGGAVPQGGPPGVPGFTAPGRASGDRPFRPRSAGQQDPAAGFLTIPREVVLGLSQAVSRWGAIDFDGASGDIQHFDDGSGLGRTISAAKRAAQARLVAAAAAAAAAAPPPTVAPARIQRRTEPGEASSEGGVLPGPGTAVAPTTAPAALDPANLTAEQRLSGAHWQQIATAWDDQPYISALESGFAADLEKFLAMLTANGIGHEITAGLRPPERSYLFKYSLDVTNGRIAPKDVPAMAGVDIIWDHGDDAKSKKAAGELADKFGLVGIAAHPSNHNSGKAVDMKLDFSGNAANTLTYTVGTKTVTRTIKTDDEARKGVKAKGKVISGIGSRELSLAGADFDVKRALDNDIVHWSRSGR
jgi:hypothetical protein